MSRSSRLSDDALSTLAEIEADARDGIEYTAAELAEYDAFCALHDAGTELPTDWHADPLADATHDAAGFPLTTQFPW